MGVMGWLAELGNSGLAIRPHNAMADTKASWLMFRGHIWAELPLVMLLEAHIQSQGQFSDFFDPSACGRRECYTVLRYCPIICSPVQDQAAAVVERAWSQNRGRVISWGPNWMLPWRSRATASYALHRAATATETGSSEQYW